MQDRSQPTAWISRSALIQNARVIRRALRPGTRVCAVVKANAYGHDANLVVDALTNFEQGNDRGPVVDCLAVATVDEAASIDGTRLPIMILRPVENVFVGQSRASFELAIENGWTLTLSTIPAAEDIARIAQALNKRANVQIMLDGGMTRCGAPVDELTDLLATIDSRPALKLTGICTHFSESEIPNSSLTADQLRRFLRATESHVVHQERAILRHAANSGGVFFAPNSHLDMVRPGLALYGVDPTMKPSMDRPLRGVMKWTAPLLTIRDVEPGTGVGYNSSFISTRATKIGLVPVGYADGYRRTFSNRGVMLVNGSPAPVVGKVSMDFTTIDLTDIPQVAVGDEVTVLDSDPISPASVYHLAKLADTIPYELFCGIGQRVKRIGVEPIESSDRSDTIADQSSAWSE